MEKNFINSSTLINKVSELIEAQKLFNIPSEKLEILIYPQSLVRAIANLKMDWLNLYHETLMMPMLIQYLIIKL